MSDITTSPLSEADPRSLEDIFNTDPLKLTEQDIEATVKYLRRARESFLLAEAKVPRAASGKTLPKVEHKETLTLDDLDL